jgi:porin
MSTILAALAALAAAEEAAPEQKAPAFDVSASYTGDNVGVIDGGLRNRATYLDNGEIGFDADLGRLIGWRGATARATFLYNGGEAPNDDAGTLQGVDNIEVSSHRGRLFEAWIQQSFGAHSVLVGLYDLNSEFYANDSAGYLLAPAFGIGSEIAATGPNGPSIFPSTALAVRFAFAFPRDYYAQFAALNADAGVIGDDGGIDTSFREGALLIGEAGYRGARKIAAGAWRYTLRQDDIREVDALGAPQREIAQGVYVLLEQPLSDPDGARALTFFARAGMSDGETTDFKGGWQAGLTMLRVFESRPESVLYFGINQGVVSTGFRRNQFDLGAPATRAEYQLELTYADRIFPHVSVQPDLQYIANPSADRSIPDAFVAALRVTLDF